MEKNQLAIEQAMKNAFSGLLSRGFTYQYTYEKGGDSSCVYIHRFQKGKDRVDFREVSGGEEINLMVFANGEYRFPNIYARYKKETRSFHVKHLFKKPTKEERFYFLATLIEKECEKRDLFGIALK